MFGKPKRLGPYRFVTIGLSRKSRCLSRQPQISLKKTRAAREVPPLIILRTIQIAYELVHSTRPGVVFGPSHHILHFMPTFTAFDLAFLPLTFTLV